MDSPVGIEQIIRFLLFLIQLLIVSPYSVLIDVHWDEGGTTQPLDQ